MLSSLIKIRSLQWTSLDSRLPSHARTPHGVVREHGAVRLLRFRRSRAADVSPRLGQLPLLIVPSLINRWTVFDLLPQRSVIEALVDAGHEVFVLDWGVPADESRSLSWADHVRAVLRMQSLVHRTMKCSRSVLIGYSSAGTLATIAAALRPEQCAGLVNIAGPIDFSRAGTMAHFADARWFDADAIASAGNVHPGMLLSGFLALRPRQLLTDTAGLLRAMTPSASLDEQTAAAITRWAYDGVPFPAKAYAQYIGGLYQNNELVRGIHRIHDELVDLSAIRAPLLSITASKDVIAPASATLALAELVQSDDRTHLTAVGGHVSALVSAHAARDLYPALISWCDRVTLCND